MGNGEDQLSALGHDFDNDDLTCSCGVTWGDHQMNASTCEKSVSRVNLKPRDDATELDNLRRSAGFSVSTIAAAAGVSRQTAERALSGKVGGGRGCCSTETGEYVRQTARAMITLVDKRFAGGGTHGS